MPLLKTILRAGASDAEMKSLSTDAKYKYRLCGELGLIGSVCLSQTREALTKHIQRADILPIEYHEDDGATWRLC